MTLSRRSFSFASLAALLGAHTARAAEPDPTPTAIPELDAVVPQAAKVVPAIAKSGDALVVTLLVHNDGPEPLQVLVAFGARPAVEPVVTAMVGGVETALSRIAGEVDRREMMSRMGPMPRWESVAAGSRVEIGPIRYGLPKGAQPPVTVRGAVDGMSQTHAFEVKGLSWASKAT